MSDKYAYTKNENIENQNVTANDFNVDNWENHHPFFESEDCGNLRITKCNFLGCMTTEDYGGGIKIDAYLTVIIPFLIPAKPNIMGQVELLAKVLKSQQMTQILVMPRS